MLKPWMTKSIIFLLVFALIIPISVTAEKKSSQNKEVKPLLKPQFTEASVHDPSVIKVDDTYYVFGSHLAAAKSKDLMNWERFASDVNINNPLFEDVHKELEETFGWAQTSTLWAADVIQLPDGKFYMYYNACKGDSPRSALGVAVADHIEGPYKNLGIILKSGMWDEISHDGTIYDARVHPNTVDPHVFFDKNGKLWMTYGSYSGGIFIMEMDPTTGMPLPDQGYGKKLLGGNHSRIEGPYVQYSPETDYYYMFLSFGGLDANGAYNMRVARSKKPDGPYYDAEGNDMIQVKSDPNLPIFDDRSIEPFGVKLMGNFLFDRKVGDPGTGIGTGYVSPGHNSTYYDAESGKYFLIFHARFPQRGEMHEVRVHQMFMNQDGWPVVAPYRYAGETIEKINRDDVIGEYKIINHGKDITAEIKQTVTIRLEKNNKISGELSGKWNKTGHNSAELTLNGETYNGVFVRQWDPVSEKYVMTFTVLSEKGVSVWGSKLEKLTDKEVVEAVKNDLTLGDTNNVINHLTLPTEGTRQSTITWETSNSEVVTSEGIITRPKAGSPSSVATLTATITKGSITATKTFTITVLPYKATGLIAHFAFENDLSDSNQQVADGNVTGNRIDNTGGTITFEPGKVGNAAVFNGLSGVRLPDGLISSNTYSVSLWLKPEALTDFTTAFFGATSPNNWLSFVPRTGLGGVNNNAMIWSGSTTWYDAHSGVTLSPNEWKHFVFTVDNGSIQVYVDGVKTFNGTGFPHVFTTTNAMFSLGVNWWDVPYKGLMDEVRIYEGVLTEDEIQSLVQ